MTPAQIETFARQKYNAVSDTFFSSSEIMSMIWDACLEFATETKCVERVYTTSTVASQQEYSYPTNTIAIKRVTCNGIKLEPIDFRDDDVLTLNNDLSTTTGAPQYYSIWNETLYLRAIPDDVYTLKIFSINEPQEVTSASTLEIPTQFHMGLVNPVLSAMSAKDKNLNMSQYYDAKWAKTISDGKRWAQKRKRADGFASVKNEEFMAESYIGVV